MEKEKTEKPEYWTTTVLVDHLAQHLTNFNDLPLSAILISQLLYAAEKAEKLQRERQRESVGVDCDTMWA